DLVGELQDLLPTRDGLPVLGQREAVLAILPQHLLLAALDDTDFMPNRNHLPVHVPDPEALEGLIQWGNIEQVVVRLHDHGRSPLPVLVHQRRKEALDTADVVDGLVANRLVQEDEVRLTELPDTLFRRHRNFIGVQHDLDWESKLGSSLDGDLKPVMERGCVASRNKRIDRERLHTGFPSMKVSVPAGATAWERMS